MTQNERHHLDLTAELALFRGQIDGIIAFFPINERPLQGLAGLLDWRFQGAISDCIKAGAISGKSGECVYLPLARGGITYHLLLAGFGYSEYPGERNQIPMDSVQAVKKNLLSLKLNKIGLSRADLGDASDEFIETHFKGAPLWIVH